MATPWIYTKGFSMSRAFVLGNGQSRLALDINCLRAEGPIYGCNALYREFTPDVLVATDQPISHAIQNTGYSNSNRFYTRKPIPGLGAQRVPQPYYGYSSGPIAVALAAQDNNRAIYMIGFDLGPLRGDRFNNVYADTEFYKKSSSRPTYTGNWVRQIIKICKDFPDRNFIRVMGENTAEIPDFQRLTNMMHMPMLDFLHRINNTKDL